MDFRVPFIVKNKIVYKQPKQEVQLFGRQNIQVNIFNYLLQNNLKFRKETIKLKSITTTKR